VAGNLQLSEGDRRDLMDLYLFDSVRKSLPKGDDNAMFLLWQIEQIHNTTAAPEDCLFSEEILNFFIEMSVHTPQLLEEFLYTEPDLSDLFEWATNQMSKK
jgi:hypothetical protein